MKLSKEQKKIINCEGKLIVLAPPGSGKTFTLCEKIKKNNVNTNKKNIVLTFSNKAAEELKERISDNEKNVIGTIHSFCQELIMTRGHLVGLPKNINILKNNDDKIYVIKQIVRENPRLFKSLDKYLDDGKSISKILSFIELKKKSFLVPKDLENKEGKDAKIQYDIYNEYTTYMLKMNLLDFDDILNYAYHILKLDSSVKTFGRVYGAIYVDEAQDLNKQQYQIIKLLCEIIPNSMLIGDPKQSLYGFMDSSPKYMQEEYKRDFSTTQMELKMNYRSAKQIVNITNLFSEEKKSLVQYPIRGLVKYEFYDTEKEEAEDITKTIIDKMDEGYKYESIAIIGRNRYLFKEIIRELECSDIKYVMPLAAGMNLESVEGKLILNCMRLINNPNNLIIKRSIAENIGLSQSVKSSIEENVFKYIKKTYQEIYNFLNQIKENIKLFTKSIKELELFYSDSHVKEENVLLLNDLENLRENWVKYNKYTEPSNTNLQGFLNDIDLGKTNITTKQGISILTVHQSKGLEFDTVFVVGMNEGTLPDYRSLKIPEKLEEEENNVYVAISRAKKNCYISAVKEKMMPWGSVKLQTESRYVKKIKEGISQNK